MMQPSVSRILSRYGTAHTLWRSAQAAASQPWKSGIATDTFYACRARHRRMKPREIAGTIRENEALFIVDASTLAITPVKGDRITRGAFTTNDSQAQWFLITDVHAPGDGDAKPLYRLTVTQ